jgi:aryl-alcohol dehydrogenase-like predicted oxidoreductase
MPGITLSPQRVLGKTGVKVPLIGYGTAPLGKEKSVPPQEAVRLINYAIDRGVTYLDTSPDYGSEPHVGEVMKTRRKEVFLATKVNNRSKDGVLEELKESLQKLQTDHVDLIQVHAVNAWADLEMALAKDGAVAALEQARKDGLVKYIGITGHARPAVLGKALEEYPFDTALCALGFADRLVSSPESFLMPRAREQNVGVIAMKVLGHGEFPNKQLALRYSLMMEGVSLAIVGMEKQEHIDQVVEWGADPQPLSEAEMERLVSTVRPLIEEDAKASQGEGGGEKPKLFWLHDTAVMGWKQKDEPALVSY